MSLDLTKDIQDAAKKSAALRENPLKVDKVRGDLIRRPKIKFIQSEDTDELENDVNNFLLSVCTLDGFEFHGIDWKRYDGFASRYYMGVISYSYLAELGKEVK